MSALQALIEKSKAKQNTFFELLGFVVLAAGIFCGLALLTDDPTDATQIVTTSEASRNMGGPVGAWLASVLLSTLGMVSLLIAVVLFFCGGLRALGFIRWPKPKRLVGFAVIVVVLSGLVHIEQPNLGTTHLPHGLGGVIGTFLGNNLLKSIGYGGAVIGLTFAGVAGLVMSGNLTASNTAKLVEYLLFLLQRLASRPAGQDSKRRLASLTSPLPSETTAQANGGNGKRTAQSMTADQGDEDEIDVPLDLTSAVPKNGKPDPNMFQTSKVNSSRKTDFSLLVKQLEGHLREFKIEGKITNTTEGPVIEDLVHMPHLLLAGTTGSGKSVFINDLIAGLVCKNSAKEMRFVFIDPKMVELAAYKNLPHLACPVISDVKTQARAVLHRLVAEMENRYEMMLALEARNIQEFNETIRTRRRSEFVTFSGKWHPLPYVVFLIDEFADLILILGKPAEELITRLAQKARAAGIHLVIATQRPSVNVVTGLIKANFPTRIAFRVQSGVDSRTILDAVGAETLLGKGDLLYQSAGRIQRLHAALLEDNEVRKLVRACA